MPTRVISARPRVNRPAFPLSPNPSASAAPAAMATMFLRAPHNSTPRMSLFMYSLNSRRPRRATIRTARAGSSAAMTADAGRPRAISKARLGPDRAAIRDLEIPAASAMTSLMRNRLPDSRPFTTETMSAPGGRTGATSSTVVRRCFDGTAKIDEIDRVGQNGRVRRGRDPDRQIDPGQPSLVAMRRRDRLGDARAVAEQADGFHRGDDRRQRRAPRAGPDDRDPRAGHQAFLRVRPADPPRRGPLPAATGALRRLLRRGSLTLARSRNTSRIGVPSNPNVSRNRFSR